MGVMTEYQWQWQERITLRELQKKWTPDFIGELLKYDQGLEVLNPPGLRLKICKIYKETLNRY